ncbi:hypothetical protein BJ165DRAFT_1404074 [Panaeolus papilionaceus]|nr:hypothetical protein BJ165DRAFT_1404074 [Panaeolus papilionaceus]
MYISRWSERLSSLYSKDISQLHTSSNHKIGLGVEIRMAATNFRVNSMITDDHPPLIYQLRSINPDSVNDLRIWKKTEKQKREGERAGALIRWQLAPVRLFESVVNVKRGGRGGVLNLYDKLGRRLELSGFRIYNGKPNRWLSPKPKAGRMCPFQPISSRDVNEILAADGEKNHRARMHALNKTIWDLPPLFPKNGESRAWQSKRY